MLPYLLTCYLVILRLAALRCTASVLKLGGLCGCGGECYVVVCGVWCTQILVSPSQAASPARKVRVVQGSAVYVVSSVHLLLLPSKPSQTLPGQNYVCQCQLVEELCLTTGEPPVPVKTWLRWHLKFWPGFGSGKHLGRAAGGSEKLNRKHLDSFH